MSIDGWDAAAGSLKAVVVTVEDELSAGDIASVWELVEVGELGIAFENLCTQLYEYGVVLDLQSLRTLGEVGSYLRLDPELWQRLETS
jgi:hypothetical protein